MNPSSNPQAVHRERNESYALKFRGALKIECFALFDMTELGIYQARSMCRKTLQPNRRLTTKRWGLAHRNLGLAGVGYRCKASKPPWRASGSTAFDQNS